MGNKNGSFNKNTTIPDPSSSATSTSTSVGGGVTTPSSPNNYWASRTNPYVWTKEGGNNNPNTSSSSVGTAAATPYPRPTPPSSGRRKKRQQRNLPPPPTSFLTQTSKAIRKPMQGMGSNSLDEKDMYQAEGQNQQVQQQQQQDVAAGGSQEPVGPDDEDDGGLKFAETYAEYAPLKLPYGKQHPDAIVETASLASVEPPDITYSLHLDSDCIEEGLLSNLQLESVVYSCQKHEKFLANGMRAGFLIGDGAGVGKGRTIAGIIYENYLCGRRKALWVSVCADLKEDCIRDLKDIGADDIPVHLLSKLKYTRISERKGVLYSTYSGLIGASRLGVHFKTRYDQIIGWLGKDFDGVIVFDECHRAKNLCPPGNSKKKTKTGLAVEKIQNDLPKARVVYASATGACEVQNMAYMTRLGIWGPGTPFEKFGNFIGAVEKRGVGAMELVAMDMKLRGTYIARQLSFKGVNFRIEEVQLSDEFKAMYNDSVALWLEAKDRFTDAIEMNGDGNKKAMSQFWGAHQRFFKYLCMACKVDKVVEIAKQAIQDGKCIVIGLQSTGEARTAEELEADGADTDLEDFVSTAKGVFQNLVEKQFPTPEGSVPIPAKGGKKARLSSTSSTSTSTSSISKMEWVEGSEDSATGSESEFLLEENDAEGKQPRKRKLVQKEVKAVESSGPVSDTGFSDAYRSKRDLLEKIEALGARLPTNTLDRLINELGGASEVAEMTGRRMRLIQQKGQIRYTTRSETNVKIDEINLTEKRRFMTGKKNIAIISEAASSGISLQSDRRAKNQKQRVHLTIELPWSADRAIQQFGRTHRSNQVNAPEYVFLISELAGEYRFASIVARRLQSLGALTHGDRRATESRDLSKFHIDNRYGKMALQSIVNYIRTESPEKLSAMPPTDYQPKVSFVEDCQDAFRGIGMLEKPDETPIFPTPTISKFLNRILGIEVNLQNAMFRFFIDNLAAIIDTAKKRGNYDLGILTLGDAKVDKAQVLSTISYNRRHATGMGKIVLHEVLVDRGMSFEEARTRYYDMDMTGSNDGFYVEKMARSRKKKAILVCADKFLQTDKFSEYSIYRPNTGLNDKKESIYEIRSNYMLCTPEQAQPWWDLQYTHAENGCSHAFWSGRCRLKTMGYECNHGKRKVRHFVLSGSVLLCWDDVEAVFTSLDKLQIVRVQLGGDGNNKFIGIQIPLQYVTQLKERLAGVNDPDENADSQEQSLDVEMNSGESSVQHETTSLQSEKLPPVPRLIREEDLAASDMEIESDTSSTGSESEFGIVSVGLEEDCSERKDIKNETKPLQEANTRTLSPLESQKNSQVKTLLYDSDERDFLDFKKNAPKKPEVKPQSSSVKTENSVSRYFPSPQNIQFEVIDLSDDDEEDTIVKPIITSSKLVDTTNTLFTKKSLISEPVKKPKQGVKEEEEWELLDLDED